VREFIISGYSDLLSRKILVVVPTSERKISGIFLQLIKITKSYDGKRKKNSKIPQDETR
jgi:hypothetical protein